MGDGRRADGSDALPLRPMTEAARNAKRPATAEDGERRRSAACQAAARSPVSGEGAEVTSAATRRRAGVPPPTAASDLGATDWERDLIKACRERHFVGRTEERDDGADGSETLPLLETRKRHLRHGPPRSTVERLTADYADTADCGQKTGRVLIRGIRAIRGRISDVRLRTRATSARVSVLRVPLGSLRSRDGRSSDCGLRGWRGYGQKAGVAVLNCGERRSERWRDSDPKRETRNGALCTQSLDPATVGLIDRRLRGYRG